MTRRCSLLVVALMLSTCAASAHEVPDHVKIAVLMKVEDGRLLTIVRMPANALIDFLFPTMPGGNWLDLEHADATAAAGASVWIVDLLAVQENGAPLPRPRVLAIRLSRLNDSSTDTFDDALTRLKGPPLPRQTLVLQDQVTVDALLETPVTSPHSSFSFEPRFARLGLVVDTTLTFLPIAGGTRRFQYQDDPQRFELDPDRAQVIARFTRAGFLYYIGTTDYLLFALCVALVFRRSRALWTFIGALACTQSLVLMALLRWMPPVAWLRVVDGVLIAATVVYTGIEAVVSGDGDRIGLAIGAGLAIGGGFWIGVQPLVQFGGVHPLAAAVALTIGVVGGELVAVLGAFIAARLVWRLARAPRAVLIIAAAIAIHIAWRRLLDRADAIALIQATTPALNPVRFATIGVLAFAVVAAIACLGRLPRYRGRGASTP